MSNDEPIVDGVDVEPNSELDNEGLESVAADTDQGDVEYDDSTSSEADLEAQIEQQVSEGGDDGEAEEEPDFPPELLQAAGITEDQARSWYQDSETLARAIRQSDTLSIQAAQAMPTQLPEHREQEEQQPEAQDDELEKVLSEWDEDSRKVFETFKQQQERELARRDAMLKQQQEALQSLIQQQQISQSQARVSEFDEFVNSLDGWEHLFGKGTINDIDRNSMFFQNRAHLERTANLLQQGRQMQGQPPLQQDELLVRSLYAAFPQEQQAVVQRQVEDSVAERQRMFSARPSQRRTDSLTPEERAGRSVEQWFKNRGIPLSQDDGEDYSVI